MRKRTHLSQQVLRSGVRFHGHLGPFLVLGLRIGSLAARILHPRGIHEMSATVWLWQTPPHSCLLDGLQVSSGCTLGKGNIKVRNAPSIRARFCRGDRSVVIRPTENARQLLATVTRHTPEDDLRKMALSMVKMRDHDLFVVSRS